MQTQSYVSETNRSEQEKSSKEIIATGVSIKQLVRTHNAVCHYTSLDKREKKKGTIKITGEIKMPSTIAGNNW